MAAGKSYILRLVPGKDINKVFKSIDFVSVWRDATPQEISQHGDSSTCELLRYYEWTREASEFIKGLPLQYKLVADADANYKPFTELWSSDENVAHDNYVLTSLLNCGANGPLTDQVDDIRLDNLTDMTLFGRLLTRLAGHKRSLWTGDPQGDYDLRNRTSAAFYSLSKNYLGDEEALKERHRDRLMQLRWDDKTTLSKFKETFISMLNRCHQLDVMREFVLVKTTWVNAISYRRVGADRISTVLNIPEVKDAAHDQNIPRFIQTFTRYLSTYLIHSDDKMPYTDVTPTSNFTSGGDRGGRRGHGRGRGRGDGGGGDSRGNNRGDKENTRGGGDKCNRCGRKHDPNGPCRADGKSCHKCGGEDHLANVCPSRSREARGNTPGNSHRTNGSREKDSQDDESDDLSDDSSADKTGRSHHTHAEPEDICQEPDTSLEDEQEGVYGSQEFVCFTAIDVSEGVDVTARTGYRSDDDELDTPSPFGEQSHLMTRQVDTAPLEQRLARTELSVSGTPPSAYSTSSLRKLGFDTCTDISLTGDRAILRDFVPRIRKLNVTGTTSQTIGYGYADGYLYDEHGNPVPVTIKMELCPSAQLDLVSAHDMVAMGFKARMDKVKSVLRKDDLVIPLLKQNHIYILNWTPAVEGPGSYTTMVNDEEVYRLRHERLGHAGKEIVDRAFGRVHVLPSTFGCDGCIQSKFQKKKLDVIPTLKEPPKRARSVLHLDGLVPPSLAIGGFVIMFILIDAFSRLLYGLLSKTKKATQLIRILEKLFNRSGYPDTIVIDRDSPFISEEFDQWCASKSVTLKPIPTARHEFNGLAENAIRTIQNWVTAMLKRSGLPVSFWGYAALHAIQLRNRLPHKALSWKSPYQVHHGKVPDLSFIRVFGCLVYYRVENPGKFTGKARPAVCVGLDWRGTHATYRLYDIQSKGELHRYIQDVHFVESMRWEQYVERTGGTYSVPSSAIAYFDMHKEFTAAQKTEHKLLVEDPDTEVHSHMTLPVVTISKEDKEYPKKKVNHAIVQKRVKKELDDALADDVPRTFADIAGRPDEKEWLEACEKENQSHAKMGSIVPIHRSKLPAGAKVAKMKRIFKKKRDGRRKVRDVFGGHTQSVKLVDDHSSPTVNPITFFTVLTLVVSTGWDYCTLDIETAYLNAVLPPDPRLFAELPDGHPLRDQGFVGEIRKAIYGMKEAGRLFFELVLKVLSSLGFRQSTFDPCLFYTSDCIIVIWVDDWFLTGGRRTLLRAIDLIKLNFKCVISKLNEAVDFIGCYVERIGDTISISQLEYIEKILKKSGYDDCKERSTPLLPGTILYPSENKCDYPFLQHFGMLMHCRITRFDILFALNQLSRIMHSPGEDAIAAIRHLFGYLRATKKQKMVFRPMPLDQLRLMVFTDAEWASNVITRKSVGADVIYFGPNPISSSVKSQSVVAPSTQASETIQMFVSAKKIVWIKAMIDELGITSSDYSVPVVTDSKSALSCIKVITAKSKHLGVYVAYLRMLHKLGVVSFHKVRRDFNVADLWTKQGSRVEFQTMKKLLLNGITIRFAEERTLQDV